MNLVILGPQGCGKGTQAEFLAKKFNLEHIDIGSALREVSKMETPLGKEIYETLNAKQGLVSDKIITDVLRFELGSLPREQGIILDGAPRRLEQAKLIESLLQESGRKLDAVIFVNISETESIKRISKRWICKKCKAVLIMGKDIKDKNDKCPKCGGDVMQREDDTEEGVKKRLAVFQKETIPVIEYFKQEGILIEIDGDQIIEKVTEDIEKNINSLKES
jgi:adenylate kinase